MNRDSKRSITKLTGTVLIAIGLLLIYRIWPDGPFSGLAIGCFGLTAGPIFILVAIDTGRTFRKEQLGRAARIATWLPQLLPGSVACLAALCGFGLAEFDKNASLAQFIWEIFLSVGVLIFGVSLFSNAGDHARTGSDKAGVVSDPYGSRAGTMPRCGGDGGRESLFGQWRAVASLG
jgi:hypothetical protein